MLVTIRRFNENDIENKVKWINDPANNTYLHYDLPLDVSKTKNWWQNVKERTDRFDAVIEADGVPCGLIGLLAIDGKNKKAEYYVSMGDCSYKGKGVATKATELLLEYAFRDLHLQRVYLYTETANIPAQKLIEKAGFCREGMMKSDLYSKGRFVDRFVYGITKDMFLKNKEMTAIQYLGKKYQNYLYIKRDDLIPYSFGGNKARKAKLFFDEIDAGNYDSVVTYGSSHSNHCRIVSNMAAARNMGCCIIAPKEVSDDTYNSRLMNMFGAEFVTVPVDEVSNTIAQKLEVLKKEGKRPYFIPGGGHGNIGTQAYVDCYDEIVAYEKESGIHFDYVFFASGTGTTQAGLVCGQIINGDKRRIIGISIARKNPRGRDVVINSIKDYLHSCDIVVPDSVIEENTIFVDSYTGEGYAKNNDDICSLIQKVMIEHGIPLDSTYTGKAFYGMCREIEQNGLSGKNILFIHTGGTPLFFDELENM